MTDALAASPSLPVSYTGFYRTMKLAFIQRSGADRARTGNPHVANVVLSQLSYGPFECRNISDRLVPEQHMSLLKEHEQPRQ
jgi:hypothetical protein